MENQDRRWLFVRWLLEAGARVEVEVRKGHILGTYVLEEEHPGGFKRVNGYAIRCGSYVFVGERNGPRVKSVPRVFHIQLVGDTPLYEASIHHHNGWLAQHAVFGDWMSVGGTSLAQLQIYQGKPLFLLAGYFDGKKIVTRLYLCDVVLRSFAGDVADECRIRIREPEHDGGIVVYCGGEGYITSEAEIERAVRGEPSGPYR